MPGADCSTKLSLYPPASEVVSATIAFMERDNFQVPAERVQEIFFALKAHTEFKEVCDKFFFKNYDGSPYSDEIHDAIFGLIWSGVIRRESGTSNQLFVDRDEKDYICKNIKENYDDAIVTKLGALSKAFEERLSLKDDPK